MKRLSHCICSVKKPADIYKNKRTDDHENMIPVWVNVGKVQGMDGNYYEYRFARNNSWEIAP